VLLLIPPIFYTCSSISSTSFIYYRLFPFPLFIPLRISVLHSLPLRLFPPVVISFFFHLLLPHPSCFFYPSVYLSSLPQVWNVAGLLVLGGDTRPDILSLCCVEQRVSFQNAANRWSGCRIWESLPIFWSEMQWGRTEFYVNCNNLTPTH